ncbi:hypothetical protein ACP4OV_026292 [Aristida adscensionis]
MDPLPPATDERRRAREREAALSTERAFEAEPVPSRAETMTARSLAVGAALGAAVSVVTMRLKLAMGFVPDLIIPADLLAFVLPPVWVRVNDLFETAHVPFTRQENTVIQTFVTACFTIAYNAMSKMVAGDGAGSNGSNVEEPRIGRNVVFLFLTCFAGVFAIMPFRNSLIIRVKINAPTGTAVAHLINTINLPQCAKQARKKMSIMFRTFVGTIAWSVFQWFFSGGSGCGFDRLPLFGYTAYELGLYFNFSMASVGVGMLSPYKITISMLVGSLVSWGLIWPIITINEGSWFPQGLGDLNLRGIQAYQVFMGISIILAECLFHLLSILLRALYIVYNQRLTQQQRQQVVLPFHCLGIDCWPPTPCFDDQRRKQVFLHDRVSKPTAIVGYVALSVMSTIVIPQLYPQLRYHHVALAYFVVPMVTFCNAYSANITDMNIATTYGRIAMLVFGSWVGFEHGGVIAALAACGIIVSSISTATNLIRDFRIGYLTLTSPHTVLISQAAGTALGCVINPIIFWIFYQVYDKDEIARYANLYRDIAMLGSSYYEMPKNCMLLCKVLFALALVLNVIGEVSARRAWSIGRYIPSTIAVAMTFFVPPTLPIGIFMGSIVMYLWRRLDGYNVQLLSPVVATGLICGNGFGSLLTAVLMFFKVRPPMCVLFIPRDVNEHLNAFLATLPKS